MMRRKTLKTTNSIPSERQKRKHRTYIAKDQCNVSQIETFYLKNNFMLSQIIVRQFIEENLMNRVVEELDKRQLKKIVDETMDQCSSLFRNENWQLNPLGPEKQKLNQPLLLPDEQPHLKFFDPMIGFQKPKGQNSHKTSTTNSIQFDRSKKNQNQPQHKSSSINLAGTRKSLRSNQSNKSYISKTGMENPKLIPLRLQNGVTPQHSTRRTLEDFLREKKINADVNLGYKVRNFSQDKENLKVIPEFTKSNFFLNTVRNFAATNQNQTKLPNISSKEECNTDYDGEFIAIKKHVHLHKTAKILKTVCTVKEDNHSKKNQAINSKYFRPEHIKLKPITSRKEQINFSALTTRINIDDDMRSLIQKNLYSNRTKFRYQTENKANTAYTGTNN